MSRQYLLVMKSGIYLFLVTLAFVLIACSPNMLQEEAGDATGLKAAVLPANIAPFESLGGAAADAKAFDQFGSPFNPRAEGEPMYIAAGVFLVKTKLTGEKNAKMANFLVFEAHPAAGTLTVQIKINGNKCFSYAFDTGMFSRQAFWTDNGNSIRYEFTPEPTPTCFNAEITPRDDNEEEEFTVPAYGDPE